MIENSILKLTYEGVTLALRAKINPSLPANLRKEACRSLNFYLRLIDAMMQGGSHG